MDNAEMITIGFFLPICYNVFMIIQFFLMIS